MRLGPCGGWQGWRKNMAKGCQRQGQWDLSPGLRTNSMNHNRGWGWLCHMVPGMWSRDGSWAEGTEWTFLSLIPHLSPYSPGAGRKADTCGPRDGLGIDAWPCPLLASFPSPLCLSADRLSLRHWRKLEDGKWVVSVSLSTVYNYVII